MNDLTKQPPATLEGFLTSLEGEFTAVSVKDKMEFAKEVHFAMQLLTKNKFLMSTAKQNNQSLKNAIINISATGLTLNPISKYAYLIPRKGEVCLDVSYLGMIKAATDTGSVTLVHAEVVKENDEFIINGIGEKPVHKFKPFGDRGKTIGAFVTAKTIEGEWTTTPMSIEEIFQIRNTSEAFKKGYGPWKDFEGEMIKKTVVKRAAKMWPRTDKFHILEKTISVANEQEGIDFESNYQREQKMIDEDFPRKEEDMVKGPDYLFIKGKYRNKRLKDVDMFELENYFEFMKKGRINGKYSSTDWVETFDMIEDWFENYEAYQEVMAEQEID